MRTCPIAVSDAPNTLNDSALWAARELGWKWGLGVGIVDENNELVARNKAVLADAMYALGWITESGAILTAINQVSNPADAIALQICIPA